MSDSARMGVLERDEAWEGDVRIEGDLVVPEGRRLLLRPGCRLIFSRSPRWACSVFRSAPEGYPIEASQRELCDVVVLGRLEALGEAERPVRFGADGGAWGGIVSLGSGRARLRDASLEAARGDAAIQVLDDARAVLERCAISGAEVGIRALGHARVGITGGSIRGGLSAVQAGEAASVRLRGVEISDVAEGCSIWECAALDAEKCRFVRARDRGVSARDLSWARLTRCSWIESGEPGERGHPARLEIAP